MRSVRGPGKRKGFPGTRVTDVCVATEPKREYLIEKLLAVNEKMSIHRAPEIIMSKGYRDGKFCRENSPAFRAGSINY